MVQWQLRGRRSCKETGKQQNKEKKKRKKEKEGEGLTMVRS
jgi:hypothetical protein